MKLKCIIEMDLDSKDYEMTFKTTEVRHEDIDYYEVKQLLDKIFSDWVNQVEESGINSDENITKEIH